MVNQMPKKPKVLVLTGYGINCDNETKLAFEMAGAEAEKVHVNDIERGTLGRYEIVALPGGFSFGDDIAAGRVLAVKLQTAGDQLREFLEGDRLLIGICNGAQAAVKMGLVPNLNGAGKQEATLTYNDSGRFEDRWVYLANRTEK